MIVVMHQTDVKWWLDDHGRWTDDVEYARRFASRKEAESVARATPMRANERKLLRYEEV